MKPAAPRRRRRSPPAHVSHERWLVSYADFITLLFAFFTTMYAISTVDAQKMSKMVESMQTAFATSGVPAVDTRLPRPGPDSSDVPPAASPDAALARDLAATLGGDLVDVTVDERGVVISIREAGSFATGSADLSPVARDVLGRLAARVRDLSNTLRIEGHTDDVPIRSGRFASNWELSTARATAVVQYFVQEGGIAPDRLSAAGYGEFHARVPNDSDANRARNRRVDVVVLNAATVEAQEPRRSAAADAGAGGMPLEP
jgi:chemotaxis protein MotB